MRAEPRDKPLPLEAVTLLGEGRLPEAIKVVKQAHGIGAGEAKARIEAHLVRDPMLRVQIETKRKESRRKFFFWFLLVDLAIAAGVIYWLYYRGAI